MTATTVPLARFEGRVRHELTHLLDVDGNPIPITVAAGCTGCAATWHHTTGTLVAVWAMTHLTPQRRRMTRVCAAPGCENRVSKNAWCDACQPVVCICPTPHPERSGMCARCSRPVPINRPLLADTPYPWPYSDLKGTP